MGCAFLFAHWIGICYVLLQHLYFNTLVFQNLLPFWTCKNTSVSDLTVFAAVGATLFCQSVSLLPATFTDVLTLPLQGKEQAGLRRKVSCGDWSKTMKFIAEVKLSFTWWQSRLVGLQACKTGNTLQKTLWRKADFKLHYFKQLLISFLRILGIWSCFFQNQNSTGFFFFQNEHRD